MSRNTSLRTLACTMLIAFSVYSSSASAGGLSDRAQNRHEKDAFGYTYMAKVCLAIAENAAYEAASAPNSVNTDILLFTACADARDDADAAYGACALSLKSDTFDYWTNAVAAADAADLRLQDAIIYAAIIGDASLLQELSIGQHYLSIGRAAAARAHQATLGRGGIPGGSGNGSRGG